MSNSAETDLNGAVAALTELEPHLHRVPAPGSEAEPARAHPRIGPSRHWWLVILWLAVLAVMSTEIFDFTKTWVFVGYFLHLIFPAGVKWSTQVQIHLIVRKLGHFLPYMVFFLVLISGPLRGRPYWSLLVCLTLASLDETHQIFLPGRTASVYDVAIDFSGSIFGRFLYLGVAGK
ncbi:MAG TPA: VanZ family protein [Candidatus Binataceae bacterium]|nr:VanZ family protein [Candidatus Binataceae bacterium]